jgi:hypothetical protein
MFSEKLLEIFFPRMRGTLIAAVFGVVFVILVFNFSQYRPPASPAINLAPVNISTKFNIEEAVKRFAAGLKFRTISYEGEQVLHISLHLKY